MQTDGRTSPNPMIIPTLARWVKKHNVKVKNVINDGLTDTKLEIMTIQPGPGGSKERNSVGGIIFKQSNTILISKIDSCCTRYLLCHLHVLKILVGKYWSCFFVLHISYICCPTSKKLFLSLVHHTRFWYLFIHVTKAQRTDFIRRCYLPYFDFLLICYSIIPIWLLCFHKSGKSSYPLPAHLLLIRFLYTNLALVFSEIWQV